MVGLWCVAAFFAVAAAAPAVARLSAGPALVYGASLAVSAAGFAVAALHLASGAAPETLVLPVGLPGIGAHFRLDALSALFLMLINFGAGAASLYALGYARHAQAPLRVLPFYPAYLGAMNLVPLADDAFGFLIAWELMSLLSWALVVADHRREESVRAGAVYLVMAAFGTLTLLFAFGLMAGPEGGYAFASMRAHHPPPETAALVLVLALAGAGSKAGLLPLHVWLPLAHPAAPSHVSALMSAVMTKVAVYAFVRIVFDLLGEPVWWSSLAVLAAGSAAAAGGVLYALMQQDLKRLLACSTIENIGVIFAALGLALAFRAAGMTEAAALALTAALLHALNHSLFKSLLFFGAGAIQASTGHRDMDRLGGLVHRMPLTAAAFLLGSAAIAALPPLNGFVSEWLTFQAVLASPGLPQSSLRFAVPAAGALLALSAALAAACFVKACGVALLGRPRTGEAAQAQEADRFMLAAMGLLALMCAGLGVLAGPLIDLMAPAVQAMAGGHLPAQMQPRPDLPLGSVVPLPGSRSAYNGLVILLFLGLAGGLTAMFVHRFASESTRRAPPWDCGYPDPSAAAQYSGASFAMPLRRVFGSALFRIRETVDMPRPGETRAAQFRLRLSDRAWLFGYGPLMRLVLGAGRRLNRLQFLTIRSYLSLVFATLILLLLVVAAWR